ncbi:MAG: hypothetical protein HXX13_15750 [Bacteroidetes bacterium]|nr:hypothetical protein [Bacteroidota bacterium]
MKVITPTYPNSAWLKASVIASYWATIEILAGSILHNFRIPVSGTILSFTAVILMTSFLYRWKTNGIIWRAGLVCALLKSISPSGVIFGPMIGIFSEALLMEFFVWIFGKNLLGYMLGGAFAVLSALIHKFISLIIIYGFDFVKILDALYHYAVKQIGLSSLPASTVVYIIIGIYSVTGMIAAILGFIVGKKSMEQKLDLGLLPEFKFNKESQFLSRNKQQHYSVSLLLINLSIMILILFLLERGLVLASSILSIFFLFFITRRYRNSMRYLKKPTFWIQLIGITLIASLLLNGLVEGVYFSRKGLEVGLLMNYRAVIVIMGFVAISAELRNPLIRTISFKAGFSMVYQSVNLAFSALPELIKFFPGSRKMLFKPVSTLAAILPYSEEIIQSFEKSMSERPSIIIISGEKQEGKTTFANELAGNLLKKGIRLSGFLAKGVHECEKRIGFDLVDLKSGINYPLSRLKKGSDDTTYKRFDFNQESLEFGRRLIDPESLQDVQLVFIDEVGPMELKNEGWSNSIYKLCSMGNIIQVWTVRRAMVEQAAGTWPVGAVYVFDIKDEKPEDAGNFIVNQTRGRMSKAASE